MDFAQALSAYRSFDPAGWVAVYRLVPTWGGLLCIGLGAVLLLFGGGSAFRLVAGPLGGVVGGVWGAVVANRLGFGGQEERIAAYSAMALGTAGFALPPSAVFFAVGVPAGLFAGELAGPTDWLLGFLPAFLLSGAVGALFHYHVGAVISSAVGGWLLVIGALSALHQAGGWVAAVASRPWGVLVAALLFAVAGSVFQLFVRPSPEEARELRAERARAKRKLKEQRALEKRWASYGEGERK